MWEAEILEGMKEIIQEVPDWQSINVSSDYHFRVNFRFLNPWYPDIILQLCLYLYTQVGLRKVVDTSWFPIRRNVTCSCGIEGLTPPEGKSVWAASV